MSYLGRQAGCFICKNIFFFFFCRYEKWFGKEYYSKVKKVHSIFSLSYLLYIVTAARQFAQVNMNFVITLYNKN